MKSFLSSLIFLSLFAHAHQDQQGSRVIIEPDSSATVETNSHIYRFRLFDNKLRKLLGESDLEVTHEKILHLIVYDPALNEFQHVHPTYDGKFWSVELNFKVSGNYWIWAQGKVVSDEDFSTSERLNVAVEKEAWPTPAQLSDQREGSDGASVIALSNSELKAGEETMLDISFARTDNQVPIIEPYLGALAHVVAVFEDADLLVHVHPMEGHHQNTGMLHVTFPTAGKYRLWVQFLDRGELKTVPLSVVVN